MVGSWFEYKIYEVPSAAYRENKCFYKNKTEHIRSIGFQLPQDVKYALSTEYSRTSFTKSQVEEDMNSHLHRVKGKNISNRMKEAKQKSSQQSYSDKVISKKEPVR